MQSTRSHPAFPYPMADSWYVVGYSDELAEGEVQSLSYFGEQLLLFRGAAGEAALVDGFCGHMGASLAPAAGGRIEGGHMVCPFHGWRWTGRGRCAAIPYADRIPERANIRSYPIREHGGVIWAWHGEGGAKPTFELPLREEMMDERLRDRWVKHEWTLRTHNQELFENGVDWPHFQTVHGFEPPAEKSVHFDDWTFTWSVTTEAGGDRVTIDNTVVGLGFAYLCNRDETLMIFSGTPLDDETVHVRMAVSSHADSFGPTERQALEFYAKEQVATLFPDFAIWENKAYLQHPTLCEADGPVPGFRKWASRFYSTQSTQEGSP